MTHDGPHDAKEQWKSQPATQAITGANSIPLPRHENDREGNCKVPYHGRSINSPLPTWIPRIRTAFLFCNAFLMDICFMAQPERTMNPFTAHLAQFNNHPRQTNIKPRVILVGSKRIVTIAIMFNEVLLIA